MTQTKKQLGQHWLHDKSVLESIVDSASVVSGDFVLEIGPGLGTLTEILLAKKAKVHAVEFDDDLIKSLKLKFGQNENFKLSNQDILEFDFAGLPKNYKIVANIPYYLTSNLIRKICELENHFDKAALLIQKEVAERVCAGPGQMSILSVATQYYCEVSLGSVVPAGLFTPPPKVDSQVLELKYRTKPLFKNVDVETFFKLVRAGFSEKRKMLRSSLSGGLGIPKIEAEELLTAAGIDPELRAQALTIDQWHSLYTAYKK